MTGGLVVRNASVSRGGGFTVKDASFTAPAGQVTGLVGPNGAGKSTMLGAVLGLHRLDRGAARFQGVDLATLDRRSRARLMAYVEQSAATEERLQVSDVVALGRIPHSSAWQDISGNDRAIIDKALARVGMSHFATRLFTTLSGGEQQRVHIARALAQEPELLLLDEPTSHLDIRGQLQVLDLLRDFATSGATVLLVLHDLNLALACCDWLVVMNSGQVVAEGRPDEVLTERLIAKVYGVRASRLVGPDGPLISFREALQS
jgi:iron complex transport system ATP-binding protein